MPVRTRARTAHTAKSSWRASVRAILAVHLVHQQPQIEAERGQQDDVTGRHRVEQHGDAGVYAIEVLTVLEAQRRKSFGMDDTSLLLRVTLPSQLYGGSPDTSTI